MLKIQKCSVTHVKEDLLSPFGFKGGYLTQLWQSVVKTECDGYTAVAPCTQSVLWSDPKVFSAFPGEKGDGIMLSVTKKACEMLEGMSFETPGEVISEILPELKKYAFSLTGFDVAETFLLNSLVGVDIALWSVWCQKHGVKRFEDMVPQTAKTAMNACHQSLARIPLVSYGVSLAEVKRLADTGTALMKIKIGAPSGEKAGSEEDMRIMAKKDTERISAIHSLVKDISTPLTKNGKIMYYLDANGRYDTALRLEQLLEGIEKMGASDRIALIEEPFSAEKEFFVGNYPYVFNADESAHSVEDVKKRIELGYKAVALKPIAKTVSVSFGMITAAREKGCGVLCADLTVNPFLAEWNKHFASLSPALNSMNVGCIEVNGDANYTRWNKMKSLLPAEYPLAEEKNGAFELNNEFFAGFSLLTGENGYYKYFGKE
ncbi:MAG: L-alanine-DL-glutamate epimerase [Clostridia bacterium]|nr:L-alanine-DL-glutamate epimerase [Clostridia bacterium]